MIKKFLEVFDKKYSYQLIYLSLLNTLSIFFEVLSIALVPIFVASLINPDIYNFQQFFGYLDFLNLKSINIEENILFFAALIIIGFLIKSLIVLFLVVYEENLSSRMKRDLMYRLYSYYINAPFSYIKLYNTSEILRNLFHETTKIKNSFFILIKFIKDTITFIFILALLFFYNFFTTFISILILILFFFIYQVAVKKKITYYGSNQVKYVNLLLQWINQTFSFMSNIKIQKLENFFKNELKKNNNRVEKTIRFNRMISALPTIFFELIFVIFVIVLSIYFVQTENKENLIYLSLLVVAIIRLLPIVIRFSSMYANMIFTLPSLDLIHNELKKLKSVSFIESDKIQKHDNDLKFKEEILFKRVSYSFEKNEKFFFSDINLNIKKNTITSVFGQSGSGKTTLINLICGLIKQQKGEILIDNISLNKNFLIEKWQDKISILTQKSYLLDDTILKNIVINEKKIDQSRLNFVLEFIDFNNRFRSNDINSKVGMDGVFLSGGQIQSISLARALYKNFEVLILDEFTNNLDKEFELSLLKKIQKLKEKENKTIIMVTHNITPLSISDEIIILKDGRINEKLNYSSFKKKYDFLI